MRPSVGGSPINPIHSIFGPAQNSHFSHGRSDRQAFPGRTATDHLGRSDRHHGRSDRQHRSDRQLGRSNRFQPDRTEFCRKLAFRQTFNAIANWNIIQWLWAYSHDIHNLPLYEHIGKISENVSEGFETSLLAVFAQRHNLVQMQVKAQGEDQAGFRIVSASEIRQKNAWKLQFPEKSQKSHLRSIWKNNCSKWPSIIVRIQELQFKFRNDNENTRMLMRCSPSLWSSFFIFSKDLPFSHFNSPYHTFFTNSSPPLTMESSTILSTKRTMQIERKKCVIRWVKMWKGEIFRENEKWWS